MSHFIVCLAFFISSFFFVLFATFAVEHNYIQVSSFSRLFFFPYFRQNHHTVTTSTLLHLLILGISILHRVRQARSHPWHFFALLAQHH